MASKQARKDRPFSVWWVRRPSFKPPPPPPVNGAGAAPWWEREHWAYFPFCFHKPTGLSMPLEKSHSEAQVRQAGVFLKDCI